MSTADFAVLLVAMGLASFSCRAAGFFAMRYVALTPRLEAALRATPIAVMTGIVMIALMRGGPAEWAGCLTAILAMRLSGRDILGAFAGVAVVAALRAAGVS